MGPVSRGLLLYDADCGFCTATARRVPLLRLPVDIASVQGSDLVSLGVDPERAVTEMPFVDSRGRVHYGHLAWAAAMRTGALPLRVVGAALGSAVLAPIAARAYRWVATHRHRLPGGTPSCELPGHQ